MPKESVVFGLAGVFFGILVGWMIGSQQARTPAATTSAPPAAAQQAQTAPPFDQSRATALEATIAKNASDVESRVQLGDLYFDAERFADAIEWYEDALKIDPKHVNASTDLGICLLLHEPAGSRAAAVRALASIDPKHTKTLLNIGIVRAFGKQDLEGAAEVWQKVIDIAPSSPEAGTARQALRRACGRRIPSGSPPAPGQPASALK